MSKLQKCLYLIDLLERRGPMTLKEINEHYRYSSQYESDIQPRTFLRYKDYILLNFPCYIEYNAATQKYYLIKNDYNKGNQSLYEYLLSAFHIEGMSELAIKHRDRIMLTDSPTGIVNVQPILEAIWLFLLGSCRRLANAAPSPSSLFPHFFVTKVCIKLKNNG